MRKLALMFHIMASFVGVSVTRHFLAGLIETGRRLGLDVDAAVLVLRSRFLYWHYRHELDGVYSFHLEQARDGAFELYWRHHSGEETPAEVFSSLWKAVAAAALQIQRYLTVATPPSRRPTTGRAFAPQVSDALPF